MQNVRKEGKMDFVGCTRRAQRLIAHPGYERFSIIRDDLIAITRRKTSIYFDKPIYVGSSVLDISKLLMYEFHYDFIKKVFPGDKSLLCFTDTDSFLYQLTTNDVFEVFMNENHRDKFDWSGYSESHPAFNGMSKDEVIELKKRNKKVVGKFKDETEGLPIISFAGLQSKVYSYIVDDPNDRVLKSRESAKENRRLSGKKFKGQPKKTVARKLVHEDYVRCLKGDRSQPLISRTIRSYNHKMYTVEIVKASLNWYDDKRYIREDGISTYAHGHRVITR